MDTNTEKNLKVSFITRDTRDTGLDRETKDVSQINDESVLTSGKKQMMEVYDDSESTIDDEEFKFSWRETMRYAPSFYLNSIPFMFNRMNPYLLNMISLVFIAFFGNATYTAAFGLGNAIFMFFWQTFTQVNGETQGINCSKAFGAGDYKLMRLHFYRGFFWNICVTLISCVLYTQMDHILIAAGFDPKMSELACSMVTYMLPALFLQTYNEMIRNYLMSQRVTKPFVFINLVTFAFFPVGGYFIIYKSGWGVPGFGLFKFIVEFMNLVGLTILLKKYGHEESIRREKVTEILNGKEFAQYMRDFGKILMGWYASYFGLEVNTILCGLTKNTVTMACWVSYMNVFAIAWTIGAGLAITTRTNAGMNVGAQKFNSAKKMGAMGLVLALVYSAIAGTLVMIFCKNIAHMFSEVPQVLAVLPHVIFCMGMLIILIGSGPLTATMFRLTNNAGKFSIMMLVNQVAINTTLACVGLFYLDLGALAVAYAFLISWGLTFIFSVYYPFFHFKWSSLKTKTA